MLFCQVPYKTFFKLMLYCWLLASSSLRRTPFSKSYKPLRRQTLLWSSLDTEIGEQLFFPLHSFALIRVFFFFGGPSTSLKAWSSIGFLDSDFWCAVDTMNLIWDQSFASFFYWRWCLIPPSRILLCIFCMNTCFCWVCMLYIPVLEVRPDTLRRFINLVIQ